MTSVRASGPLLVLLSLLAPCAPAATFPEVSAGERALAGVPGYPGAPAVVLFKRAELRLSDSWTDTPSTLDVLVRVKVLSERGKAYGQVEVGHGTHVRLEGFEGRTVLADGRVVPLAADSIFREEQARVRRRFVTKAAFPAVEVGAILDYRYRLRWSSVFVEPWTFDERIPVLLSELVYHRPIGMIVEHHLRGGAALQTQTDATARGSVVRLAAENLPPVVEEPFGLPWADVANQVVIVAQSEVRAAGAVVPLLDSWNTVCRNFEERVYEPLRKKARQVKKRASQLVAGAGREPEARIAALTAYVRDDVRTTEPGISTAADSLDAVLAAGRGTYAEKALLLQALLKSAGVPSRLVWAIDWREGFADLEVVNPGWFEKVLVRAEAGGRRLYLDPGERVAAGRLAPTNEGTEALVVDGERPEVVVLPSSPAGDSRRRAELELQVDAGGRVAGRGRLVLSGHHAWYYLSLAQTAAVMNEAWRQWLVRELEGYDVGDVETRASVDEQRIEVTWTMALAAEQVLGDEVSLLPSRPLGPLRQRYTIPPEKRRTPVHVSFADRDEVELTLVWPPGWRLDLLPDPVDHASAAGAAHAELEVDDAGRRLVYRRSLEITGIRYEPGEPYARLRELYTVMERHDAQSLVLYRGD